MRRSRLSAGGRRKQIIRSEGQRMLNVNLSRVHEKGGALYNPVKSLDGFWCSESAVSIVKCVSEAIVFTVVK